MKHDAAYSQPGSGLQANQLTTARIDASEEPTAARRNSTTPHHPSSPVAARPSAGRAYILTCSRRLCQVALSYAAAAAPPATRRVAGARARRTERPGRGVCAVAAHVRVEV